jgi:hypothetical protein
LNFAVIGPRQATLLGNRWRQQLRSQIDGQRSVA